jgi:hypothetical protein
MVVSWWRWNDNPHEFIVDGEDGGQEQAVEIMRRARDALIEVEDHLLPDKSHREWLDSSEGAYVEKSVDNRDVTVRPAIMMPAGTGLITVAPGRVDLRSQDVIVEDSKLLTAQEWEIVEAMGNLHELSYDNCSATTLSKERLEFGPPMDLVVAISYLDKLSGKFITMGGIEQFRIPYKPELNADGTIVPSADIKMNRVVDLRTIHYFDPMTWAMRENWSSGRYLHWTRKTTRPFEIWPEAWNADGVSLEQKQTSIADEYEKKARERKVIRDRTVGDQQAQRIPGSRDMPVPALAAAHCDFAKWGWTGSTRLDLEIHDMPLLQRDLREHLMPPRRREKTVDVPDMPWNCCVARPVFKNEIRKSTGARKALREEWDRLRLINTWREDLVEEWDVVKARAKKAHTRAHVGMVFQICVEKDSETEKPEKDRKYKGLVVFRGNDVVDENWDIAMFQELGSAPATMRKYATYTVFSRVISLRMPTQRRPKPSQDWEARRRGYPSPGRNGQNRGSI